MTRRGSSVGVPRVPRMARAVATKLTFRARQEPTPGSGWQARFKAQGPAYRAWYLGMGDAARPCLKTCLAKLDEHMPELVPLHRRLVELAGSDELDARMLALYNPPPFVTGCSQAAWVGDSPLLIRNYDYPVTRLEGLLLYTQWTGRRVIGMSDCLWGLLDGVNEDGLAVSLTFGGRPAIGDGFAVSLIVRYLLEVCSSVAEGCEVLARVPVHASQNITLVDAAGDFITAYISPDRPARFVDTPVTTNHQDSVAWPAYEQLVHSVKRERRLLQLLADPAMTTAALREAFFEPPLYSRSYAVGAGTLYNACYYPAEGRVELRWPHEQWDQSFDDFRALEHTETYGAAASASKRALGAF